MDHQRFLNQGAVDAEFQALGFASAADAKRFRDAEQLHHHLLTENKSTEDVEPGDGAITPVTDAPKRFRQMCHVQLKMERAGRDLVGLGDPASRSLRHFSPPRTATRSALMNGTTVGYVRPDSLQSSQSPAAYLAHLHTLAKTRIVPSVGARALDTRRPDLKNLVLSEDNLNEEITTLSLVNEVLTEQLLANGIADNERALFTAMETTRHPLTLPFHKAHATVRESLNAMSGLSLNAIADRGRPDAYALTQAHFTRVPNSTDRLRLCTDHVTLLGESPTRGTLYGTWYGLADPVDGRDALQYADTYCAAAGLEFDEFRALVRDDVNVEDEFGRASATAYVEFLAGGEEVVLVEGVDGRWKTEGPGGGPVNSGFEPARHTGNLTFEPKSKDASFSIPSYDWRVSPGTSANTIDYDWHAPASVLYNDPTSKWWIQYARIEVFADGHKIDEENLAEFLSSHDSVGHFTLQGIHKKQIAIPSNTQEIRLIVAVRFYDYHSQSLETHTSEALISTYARATRSGAPLPSIVHEIQNKCIRLQRRMGLPFHQLDWLLRSAHQAGGGTHTDVLRDGRGLMVLAHFLDWRDRHELTVDEFAALICHINYYHRQGSGAETLMRQLFGADAAELTGHLNGHDHIPIADLDAGREHLGEALRRGLRLSRTEWGVIVNEIVRASGIDTGHHLDNDILGRMYRLATLFRLLGWSVLEGIALTRKVDARLLSTLAASADCRAVLTAMETLSWLAGWMATTELAPAEVIAILTAPVEAQLHATEDTLNWVRELHQLTQDALITALDFAAYETWGGTAKRIPAEQWLAGLGATSQTPAVLDNLGLLKTGDRTAVEAKVAEVLSAHGVDIGLADANPNDDVPANRALAEELIDRLVGREGEQADALATQIERQSNALAKEAVPGLLRWMGTASSTLLATLLAWNTEAINPADSAGLRALYDLQRHLLVADKLRLQGPEIELVADRPLWIATGMARALSLPQVHLLAAFKGLQNAQVTAGDWIAYFAKVAGEGSGADQRRNHELLTRFLDWPTEEIALLADTDVLGIANQCVATVQQADYLVRRIELCRDAAIGAAELIALEAANGDAPNWTSAAVAAEAGLRRFDWGAHAATAKGALDEEIRDVLVGLYRDRVLANDPVLAATIQNEENLYEYLLLDVNVSSAVPTSRMVEATGSVQLYINRALENIEEAAFADKDALLEEWETAQQYRLWEANEKLKLYPSSYIEPELRGNRSELFVKFEQDLTMGDLDEDTVNRALSSYVGGLQRMAELRAHGFFFARDVDITTYYFTARASWEKYGYYYRKLEIDRTRLLTDQSPHAFTWGDWKKAHLPLAAQYVYGVVPAYAWNRLYLFWFELEERTITNPSDNSLSTRHFLRPKYSRHNIDGSFSEPWSPSCSRDQLEVSDLIGDDPASYNPLIYQPYYSEEADGIELLFALDANRTKRFRWVLSETTGANDISAHDDTLDPPHTLGSYNSVPHTAITMLVDEFSAISTIDPEVHYDYYFGEHGGAFTHIGYRWELGYVEREHKVHHSLWGSPSVGHFDGYRQTYPDGSSEATGLVEAVSTMRIDGVSFVDRKIADSASPDHHGLISIKGSSGYIQNSRLTLDVGRIEFILNVRYKNTKTSKDGVTNTVYVTHEQTTGATYSINPHIAHLYYGKSVGRAHERYLLTEDRKYGTFVTSLFSTGIKEIAGRAFPGLDPHVLLALENQRPVEAGVSEFLTEVSASTKPDYDAILEPKPDTRLDFNGPYGLYAWELFFHLPLLVAAKYREAGRYEAARDWLDIIFSPQAENDQYWRCWPLTDGAMNLNRAPAFAIADPDRIAQENPTHYRLAVQRHYLRTMIDQGDDYYRQETRESLRLAKMWYVNAKNLFVEGVGDGFNQSTRDDWTDPTLGSVNDSNFRPPYNQEVRDAYETLEERLDNLRHWRAIDGSPLNLPLLSPPLDPRQLQVAALSRLPATAAKDIAAQTALPYTFDTALSKAKEAVTNLMSFGNTLNLAMYRRDEQGFADLKAAQAHYLVESFEVAGQRSLIESMRREQKVLEKEREAAQKYLDWYTHFAGEKMNGPEIAAQVGIAHKAVTQTVAGLFKPVEANIKLLPTIFGFAVGGAEPGAFPETISEIQEYTANVQDASVQGLMHQGSSRRRQQVNTMEKEAREKLIQRIDLELERLDFDIARQQETLAAMREKAQQNQAMVDFQARRSTSTDFHNWHVGRLSSLNSMAYDITLRFCRLAERAFQVETGNPSARFVNPSWDAQHHGQLSGQSLMLDLQRMDYAYMEQLEAPAEGQLSISLRELDPMALTGLKETGRAVFGIDEGLFDAELPDEYQRRIKSVRVRLQGNEKDQTVRGRLALLGHRTHFDRERPRDKAEINLFGRQQIALTGQDTDTNSMTSAGGRFRPFERCGVESAWMLSFPGAVRAIEARHTSFKQQALLEGLEDVVIDIRYTARV